MKIPSNIKAIVFDWGDTIMRDFDLPGPMSQWDKVAWVAGAETALKALSPKYTCIIATSADHSDTVEMKAALARVGADSYFHRFYSQKELGYKKPDVRFFQAVLKLSGFKPEESLMVGNLYEKDITGAKQAGMTTVFFNENGQQGDFEAADYQISQMGLIIELF
jgi:HAD superfamily hydrolase (TIGR01509 family)